MKKTILLITVILFSGCEANHQHDGLYIANQKVMGIMHAWILEGDQLTYYAVGTTKVKKCVQFEDRIEIEGGETYNFNAKGDIVISEAPDKTMKYGMVRVSERTKYTFKELDKLTDDAYQKERESRIPKKVE